MGSSAIRPEKNTFTQILLDVAGLSASRHIEPFSDWRYADELRAKTEALARFWRINRLPGAPRSLIPSQLARGYRTTTKRRAILSGKHLRFAFANDKDKSKNGVAASSLEPQIHLDLYGFVHTKLTTPAYLPLAKELNWVVIRGFESQVVIFNICSVSSQTVRKLKLLSEHVKEAFRSVLGCVMYWDPSRSPYYLDSRRPEKKQVSYKRLCGTDMLHVAVNNRNLKIPATVFSQVNSSMHTRLIDRVESLLSPIENTNVVDLYCGFGFFSHALVDKAACVIGIDAENRAIESARANAEYFGYKDRAVFIAAMIDPKTINKRIRFQRNAEECIVMDPPRKGAAAGVIAALASRGPRAIAHIFCGTDTIPDSIAKWREAGFKLKNASPMDLFPGTLEIETIVLFEPK